MKSEATLIIEAIRAVLILAAAFGVIVTEGQQVAIIGAATALILLASAGLAWLNRNKVFSEKKVEEIAAKAAATGDPTVGSPPAG
jgi:hypothetical protein